MRSFMVTTWTLSINSGNSLSSENLQIDIGCPARASPPLAEFRYTPIMAQLNVFIKALAVYIATLAKRFFVLHLTPN